MKGRPIVFHCDAGACLGWFHAGATPRRRVVVVMCRPLGYEALCSYRTYTQLAETLAAAGFDVLRFDYHGTGDSSGGDADPQRVPAWLSSLRAATETACRLAGTTQVALFGISAALCAAALTGSPPIALLYVLAGLLAGFGAVQNVARSAIVPNLVAPERIRSALALNFGLYQLTMVIGPALGGDRPGLRADHFPRFNVASSWCAA